MADEEKNDSQKRRNRFGMSLLRRHKRKEQLKATVSAVVAAASTATKAKPTTTTTTNSKSIPTAEKPKKAESKKLKKSFLARTKFFKNMCDSSFALVDQDGSGDIDEKELYSGLLLIHLKLGTYAGPAACKPISREKCHSVFLKMDVDSSGRLDKDEFEAVMMILFGNVLMRVLFQYACTLLVVPLVAKHILDGILWLIDFSYQFITTLDEHSELADKVEVSMEQVWDGVTSKMASILPWDKIIPNQLWVVGDYVNKGLDAIPASVWATIPLTLISTILSLMLIPWSLMKIDDIFQSIADKKAKEEA